MKQIDRNTFESKSCIDIGCLRKEFVDFFNTHGLDGLLKYDTHILFWQDRIVHTDAHKKDFSSDMMYYRCFEEIPMIIAQPDYISVHPKDKSISFIRNYTSNRVNVAIRVSISGGLAYRTMYPLMEATLTHYLDTAHAWAVEYKNGKAYVIDKKQ